jgi:galactose mutarotase-like enzyme
VVLRSDAMAATFLPSLGMVCRSLEFEGEEMLALRGGPEAYAERGSTFGIPLLHPWANRLSDWSYDAGGKRVVLDRASPYVHVDGATGLPIHGLLGASRFWVLSSVGETSLSAELDFGSHPELLAGFPFPHLLELSASLAGSRLSVRLAVTPTGDEPVPISFGFHPYLRPGVSHRRGWRIELPVRRRAVLDGNGIPTGAGEELAPGELSGRLEDRAFDDCFDDLTDDDGPPVFSVADERRRIAVEYVSGYVVAQVYAPAESQFVCFETMTAPIDALRTGSGLRWADPGSAFSAEFAVTVTTV